MNVISCVHHSDVWKRRNITRLLFKQFLLCLRDDQMDHLRVKLNTCLSTGPTVTFCKINTCEGTFSTFKQEHVSDFKWFMRSHHIHLIRFSRCMLHFTAETHHTITYTHKNEWMTPVVFKLGTQDGSRGHRFCGIYEIKKDRLKHQTNMPTKQ